MYPQHLEHEFLRPREKFVIMTKTFSRKPEEARADIERFRKEIGVEYIDLVLRDRFVGETMIESAWRVIWQVVGALEAGPAICAADEFLGEAESKLRMRLEYRQA